MTLIIQHDVSRLANKDDFPILMSVAWLNNVICEE